ncbi:MAG TPA: hypothetical protein VEJ63_12730, partial [Planctomycetota bacterium]|nr:hypothetical protein [Planctomycetota bacterium]
MKRIRHFFANPPVKSKELTIHGVGVQERMPPRMVERPQGTGDYLFMVFFEPVHIDVAGKLSEYPAGSIVMWDRGAGHIYG